MNVLIADAFDAAGLDALRAAGCNVAYEPDLQGDALTLRVRESRARVLIVRGTAVNAATLGAAELALVIRAGAGYNTIDTGEAARQGIHVSTCPGRNAAHARSHRLRPHRPRGRATRLRLRHAD